MARTIEIAIGAALIAVVAPAPALAYLDPGTGSLILQAAIGGIAGGLFILRTWWSRIASLLPGRRKGQAQAEPDKEPR